MYFHGTLSTSVLKFFSEMCPLYMNEIYKTIKKKKNL